MLTDPSPTGSGAVLPNRHPVGGSQADPEDSSLDVLSRLVPQIAVGAVASALWRSKSAAAVILCNDVTGPSRDAPLARHAPP
jgi:hypothetical protein